MLMESFNRVSIFIKSKIKYVLMLVSLFLFISCFTGIESTKMITLNKEDKRRNEPSPEETYMSDLKMPSISSWNIGKPFYVVDDRVSVILSPDNGSRPVSDLVGDTLYYCGSEIKYGIGGERERMIRFRKGNDSYKMKVKMVSDSIVPDIMMVDLDLIDSIGERLIGKHLFLRTGDWEDASGSRKNGRKFIEILIEEVSPGSVVFPVKIGFKSIDLNETGFLLMNYGQKETGSRSFSELFYLTDPRLKYTFVRSEFWPEICRGAVKEGMSKEECRLSIGNPYDSNTGRDYNRVLDVWKYKDGTILFFEDGILVRKGLS